MSGSPSRPTPPSRPQSISHEGITISGVRVAPVLQGTCSQDHWLMTGRPHLGGYMSPGGSFALSASTSRSSGSAAAVHGTREKGRADMAAQDKIHSSGSRSPPTPEQGGSKIPTWRSFSAGSCNWSFNAQLRPSRREVRDGSEFKFSLRSSRSPSSSSDGSLHYSMLAPDDASIPRNQDSMVSVQLRSPKSPSGSVEYACTASPSRTANVLPGSPLRRTALDTKVSTRVTTTTVAWTPPAHAIGLTPRRSSVSGMSSREMPKIDKQEEQRRRSVTFTGAPLMAAVPENSLREVTTINSTIPESKSGPPQEQSEFPVPKTMELQNLEPRLGPPEKEDKEAERVSSVDVRLKPGSEPSKLFQDIGAPKEPVKSEGLQATSKRHWRSTAGHTPSAALVLKDESEQNTTLGAARPQPAPAGVSVAKEVSPAEVSDEDDSAPIATMNIDVPISKPDYQPSVLLSESGRNETEATEMTVAAPPLPADHLESQREEKRKRDASALVEIDKEDRSIRAAQDAEGFLLSTGTLFGPEEHVITDDVKATLSPTTVIETPPSNQRLKSGEGVETMKRADTKAFGSRAFEEGSTRPEKRESDELAEDTNVEEIFAEAETYLHGSKMEERTKRQSHERATFSEQEPQAEPKTTISDEIQAQPGTPATAPEVDRRENHGDAQAAAGRHLEQAGSAVQACEGTLTKSAQDSDAVPEQVEAPQAPVQTKIAPEALPYDEVSASSPVDLVIEENKVSCERTVAAGPRELEAKTDIQLPEITHELPIRPKTTGGSLEGESQITDHAKHNRTKSREECSLARSFDKSRETRTLREVSQAQKEMKPTEVLEIPTKETAAATEALARDKFASPIEADSAAQTVRPKPVTDIRSPGIEDEHSMHSRPMGGLFERGRIIAETVEREDIKLESETGPWKFAHISRETTAEASNKHEGATETNQIKAIADVATPGGQNEPQVQHEAAVASTAASEYAKSKSKGHFTPPEIEDEHSLFQRATEGPLESEFHPSEQANHQKIKTSAPETLLAPRSLVHKPEEEKMSVNFREPRVEARISLNKPAYEAETATAEGLDHDDVRAPIAPAHVPDNFGHASKHETWPPHIQAFFLKSTATGALLKEDSSIIENAKNGETNAVMAGSEEAKDAVDGSDAGPHYLFQMPEEKRAFVEVSELQRGGRRTPASESTTSKTEQDVRREPKPVARPPEIQKEFFLEPRVTGGLLEEHNAIIEHVTSDKDDVSEAESVAELYILVHVTEPTTALVEVGEPHDKGKTTVTEPTNERTVKSLMRESKSKLNRRMPEIEDEFFLQPRVTGGLLEKDGTVLEYARSEKVKPDMDGSEIEPYYLFHVPEEKRAFVEVGELHGESTKTLRSDSSANGAAENAEREPKLDSRLPEIKREFFLEPSMTGGCLEVESMITDHGKSEGVKADVDGSDTEPYYLFHVAEQKRAFVKVGELHREGRRTQGSESNAEIAAESVKREPKLDGRPPEVKRDWFLQPYVTGCCLEVENMITDHETSEGVKADVDGSEIEPYYLFHMLEEKRAFVEVGELHGECRLTLGSESSTEGAADYVEREPKLDGCHPEIKREFFVPPNVTGGCLEVDSIITNHDKFEDVEVDVDKSDIEPYYLFHMPEEKRTFVEVGELHREGRRTPGSDSSAEGAVEHVEHEPKLNDRLPEIKRELILQPNVTGGCLEVITNHDKSEGAEADVDKSNIEPYYFFHMPEEKRALGEVGELHGERRTPGSESGAEGAAKNVEREPKLEARLPEISRELFFEHGVMGGYLEGRCSSVEATKHVDEDKPAAALAVHPRMQVAVIPKKVIRGHQI
ncbi:uncharacterized protein LOC142766082 [Rhipicephalus microplus]|uniref:uncharacterized protein LOC142766082 n=1 Tax=Rhipicephalus microplus TaxID=6941 RepID=UPI003F6D848A